jgi:hypothetical protein
MFGKQGSYTAVNLAGYLKDRRAAAIIHRSIYIRTHRRESKQTIILANVFKEAFTASITIKSGQRGKGLRSLLERRYDDLSTLAAPIVNKVTSPHT